MQTTGSNVANPRVAALDLTALASLVGCSPQDLQNGIGHAEQTIYTEGRCATAKDPMVLFDAIAVGDDEYGEDDGSIRTALLSVASRPGALDSVQCPKPLLPLGNEPVLAHVLKQLHLGGIRKVVLVLGANGSRIREAIENHPLSKQLTIEYVDLGAEYVGGFALSLLQAKTHLGDSPFLLCTADHIFDPSLVHAMRTLQMGDKCTATLLMESDIGKLDSLPITAVRVRLSEHAENRVSKVGRNIGGSVDGIEAGIYACKPAVFSAFEQQHAERSYFTVAQAMQSVATSKSLFAEGTRGKQWYAIETDDQRNAASRTAKAWPWQLRLSRAPAFAAMLPDEVQQDERLVLAINAAAGGALRFTPAAPADAAVPSYGFSILPVSSDTDATHTRGSAGRHSILRSSTGRGSVGGASSPSDTLLDPTVAKSDDLIPSSRTPPLIIREGFSKSNESVGSSHSQYRASTANAAEVKVLHAAFSPLETGAGTAPALPVALAVSIELTPDEQIGNRAYLVSPPDAPPVLAVPDPEPPQTWFLGLPSELPSDIEAVYLERASGVRASATGDPEAPAPPALQLTVEKRVPVIGWALLVAALIFSQSGGPAADLQLLAMPGLEPGVFLRCVWRGMCSSLFMFLVSLSRPSGREALLELTKLSAEHRLLLLGAGLAYLMNFGLFTISLSYTSLSHAALFESTASLWMVTGAMLGWAMCGRAAVATRNVLGASAGAMGIVLCLMDKGDRDENETAVAIGNALALLSGLGSCLYLSVAESLRLRLDPVVFYFAITFQFFLYNILLANLLDETAPVLLSTDPKAGFFGWLNMHPSRFVVQLYMAAVVDYAGNLGFIAVMKYVPGLIVASAMLVGPFVACIEGILVGVDVVPGPWTMIGAVVITASSAVIAAGSQHQTKTVDIIIEDLKMD